MMIFVNDAYKVGKIDREKAIGFVKLLSAFAPHLGEELYSYLTGKEGSMAYEPWPTYDESKITLDNVTIVVQVNGKVRGKFDIAKDADKAEVEKQAMELDGVKANLEGKTVKKVIVVPNKIVNIVAQ